MDTENFLIQLKKLLKRHFGLDIPASHYAYQFGTYREAILYSCLYLPLEMSQQGDEIIGYALKPRNYQFDLKRWIFCEGLEEETELLLDYMLIMWRGWFSLLCRNHDSNVTKLNAGPSSCSAGLRLSIGTASPSPCLTDAPRTPAQENAVLTNIKKRLDQESQTLTSYFQQRGVVAKALMYAPLFCPLLKEVDGSLLVDVFEDDELEAKFKRALLKGWPRPALESSFNCKEIDMVLVPQNEEDDDLDAMAYRLRDAWGASLAGRIPDRRMTVTTLQPQEEGGALGIDVYSTSNEER